MNKKVMGKAGHVGKIVLLLARTLSLSKRISDCKTKHPVKLFVTNKKFLEKLNGRFYRLEGEDKYRLLKAKKCGHLIGRVLEVRSPATCSLGDHVCQKCYGYNANLNYDIADGVSAFGSEEFTKVINQLVLSAKHLLSTISEKITFNEVFDKFFNILFGEISAKSADEAIEDIDDWFIHINPDDILKAEELDDDSLYNNYIHNGTFYLRNSSTGEELTMKEEKEKELYLSSRCIEMLKEGKGNIKFKDIDGETPLFVMEITNNELTKPLYDIIDLLNKVKKKGEEETIDSMCQKMIDLFVESGIDASAVQGELVINRLLREDDESYERPDFSHYKYPKYHITTVSRALEHNKSPLLGLSFQDIKRQILSDETFYRKDAVGYIDDLYKTVISTKKFKNY